MTTKDTIFHRIESVRVAPHRNLLVTFEGDIVVLVDFSPIIERGGIFAALDDEETFHKVQIEDDGHTLVWPGGIDFFADRLWEKGTKINEDSDGRPPAASV